MPLFEKFSEFTDADQIKAAGVYPYFRPISGSNGTRVIVNGVEKLMVGSNNYLGLSHHPEVVEAAKAAIDKYGAGCTGSRFLNGNMDLHDQLEAALARFFKREQAIVYSTGFHANQGSIPSLSHRHSVIFSDRDNHASITEGCSTALAKVVRYAHNDMQDLARLLETYRAKEDKLIVTDGIFSMSGVLVNLPEIVRLAREHRARLYVDDAHSAGVIGKNGRGTGEHFGLEEYVDVQMGTFSKAFASIGGFVVGDHDVMNYIKHHSRTLIFSASIPPASAATVIKSIELIERHPEMLERLNYITRLARQGFKELGFKVDDGITPIIPVILGRDRAFTFTFAQALFDAGLFVTPVVPPAVPQGTSLIRTSYMATHTEEDIQQMLQIFKKVGEQFGVIGR